MKHKGLNTHRLASNPLEKKFADAWQKANDKQNILAYILDSGNAPNYAHVSERDVEVAASVIQWLGSPVGQYFLDKVMEASK